MGRQQPHDQQKAPSVVEHSRKPLVTVSHHGSPESTTPPSRGWFLHQREWRSRIGSNEAHLLRNVATFRHGASSVGTPVHCVKCMIPPFVDACLQSNGV